MDIIEELTLKEKKIIVLAESISIINQTRKRYTRKELFEFYNNILIEKQYDKASMRSFYSYLVTLENHGIIGIFRKRFANGIVIFCKVLLSSKKYKEVLQCSLIKSKINAFNVEKKKYFKWL